MCIICVDIQKDRLSAREARRNLGEMRASLDPEHVAEVEQLIEETEENEQSD